MRDREFYSQARPVLEQRPGFSLLIFFPCLSEIQALSPSRARAPQRNGIRESRVIPCYSLSPGVTLSSGKFERKGRAARNVAFNRNINGGRERERSLRVIAMGVSASGQGGTRVTFDECYVLNWHVRGVQARALYKGS